MTTRAEETQTISSWPNWLSVNWYTPGSAAEMFDVQIMPLQRFAHDLQKAYADSYHRQVDVLNETEEMVATSVRDLLRCEGAGDVLNVESQLATAMLDDTLQWAETWFELGRKVQDCMTTLARASCDQGVAAETVVQEPTKRARSATRHAA